MSNLVIKDCEGIAGRGHWRVEFAGELLATFPYHKICKHDKYEQARIWKSGVEVGIGLVETQFYKGIAP